MGELFDAYQKYFEIEIADTQTLRNEAYRLRYQVLCMEDRIPGFDASEYPEGLEKDTYDKRALHALLKHRPSGKFIGTVRIVLPDSRNPNKPFPLEAYTDTNLDTDFFSKNKLSRQHTVEISRFIVISEFQRRKDDFLYPHNTVDNSVSSHSEGHCHFPKERRVTINLTLILMAAVVRMSVQNGIKNWLSFMHPALNRRLRYSGLDFTPIGPLVDCHGLRRPYFVKIEDILHRTQKGYHDVWEILTNQGQYLPNNFSHAHQYPITP